MKTLGLNLRQLQVFVRVVETRSFSRAAEELGVSQPQVSRTIADIERKLRTRLFFRTPAGLELTPTGVVLHRFARQTLDLLYETEVNLDEQAGVPACPLHVGSDAALLNYAVAGVKAFREEYPELPVYLEVAGGYELLELVSRQQVSLGLLVGPGEMLPRNVTGAYLGRQEWGLLVGPDGLETDPAELPLLLPPEGSWERQTLERQVELPQPRVPALARDVRAACALAAEGFAAFLPLRCRETGLVLHAALPPFELEVYAVSPPSGRYPVSARAYLRLLGGLDLGDF
ncbi:LysR family transcriptional regulator [Oceanithermus sp.]